MNLLSHGHRRRRSHSGQSLVEFALIVPILLILFLAVADLARIYTAMGTIESAAREAADFGAWNSSSWSGDRTNPATNAGKTTIDMRKRACAAARTLTDYQGPDDSCTNPTMTFDLVKSDGTSGTEAYCSDKTLTVPCRVKVTLSYNFRLIAPLSLDIFGTHYGFPNVLTFTRDSIYAISDFQADAP